MRTDPIDAPSTVENGSIAAESGVRRPSLSLEDLGGSDGDSLLPLPVDGLRLHVAVEGVLNLDHLRK